jgi:hypothetical protein
MVDARFRFAGRCVTGSRPSEPNPPVAPNFSLREFARQDGSYFIHPNLILTLQNIRNLLGQTVNIVNIDEGNQTTKGFCASIRAGDLSRLKAVCSGFLPEGSISKLVEDGDNLFLEARPSPTETLSVEDAFDTAFYLTAGFETSGDPFQQVTGNFDGAGLSFGPSQANFGTGTLVQLLRRFKKVDPAKLRECFGGNAHWDEWRALWDRLRTEQIRWADQQSTGSKKQDFKEPWRGYLKQVGQVPIFRKEMVAFSKELYGGKLRRALKWLQTVWPQPITDLRCFCALFDLCTQQGSLDKAHSQIETRMVQEKPKKQREVVQIAVEERARMADPPWRAASISRRLGILYGAPVSATESGKTAQTDNPYFSLLPEMEVQGAKQFLASP